MRLPLLEVAGFLKFLAIAAVLCVSSSALAEPGAGNEPGKPRLRASGDFRLRAQGDYSDDDRRSRTSGQVRARLGATYAVNELFTVGARLATGDPDDPNSSDVQLSNFDDELDVSLDLAYLQMSLGKLTLSGGKTPQPFTRTDLVWDGDVNPQGVSGTYKQPLAKGLELRLNGLFFLVDEQAAGRESTMSGVQLGLNSAARGAWRFEVSAAYYDYSLGSVATADSGDLRSNLLTADGRYLSDFNLGDVIVGLTWNGLNDRWPLRLTGDYVRNFGAATDADTGYALDLALGRARAPHDWRVTYGYSAAETDAVFAAFSHDNTSIATNYLQHSLGLDYVLLPNAQINAVWYHYRPYHANDAGSDAADDWLDRFRLAIVVSF